MKVCEIFSRFRIGWRKFLDYFMDNDETYFFGRVVNIDKRGKLEG